MTYIVSDSKTGEVHTFTGVRAFNKFFFEALSRGDKLILLGCSSYYTGFRLDPYEAEKGE